MGLYGAERFHYLQNPSSTNAYCVYRGLFPPQTIQALLSGNTQLFEPMFLEEESIPPLSDFDRAVYFEFNRYLHNQLLRDTDVMSMYHSVEMRVPFLDHELVETILRIPVHKRFQKHMYKALLQKMVANDLPKAILSRPKQGFILPLDRWMRSSLKPCLEEVFFDSDSFWAGFPLNQEAILDVWRRFLKGEVHWSQPWALFVLKRWWDQRIHGASEAKARRETSSIKVTHAS